MAAGATAALFSFGVDAAEISGELVYTGELWGNTRGGIKTGVRYLHNIDATLTADWGTDDKGGTFFIYGLHNNGDELSADLIGDAQVISNIDNTAVNRLYEAWYEHRFADGAARVKGGLIDLNSEFDAIEPGGLFINSSHGIGPDFSQSGDNGPSIFPSTSLAALAEWAPVDSWSIKLGVFDAVPNDPDRPKRHRIAWDEGTLFVGEINHLRESGLRIALGGWAYTSEFERVSGTGEAKNGGAYAILEGPIGPGMTGWVRGGFANSSVNQFGGYAGGGVVQTGAIPGRPDDQLGIAIAIAMNGGSFKRVLRQEGVPFARHESNVELTYRAELAPGIAVQPNFQYVFNPGATSELRNAFVVGARLEIGTGF